MTRNPILNALAAAAYIAVVASILFFGQTLAPTEDTVLIPITMISLLVLSVLVMALCFFYQPALLFGAGETRAAIALFAKSAGTFAIIAVLLLITMIVFTHFYAKRLPPYGSGAPVTSQPAAIQ
jgi:hypothetical protein